MEKKRIAIIGGGVTGLSLAYFLGRDGFSVTIIEKGKELSGLLAFTSAEGVPIERFYHHFFTNDRYLLALLDELGLSKHILWRESASAVYRDGSLFPFGTKADALRLPFLSAGAKMRGAAAAVAIRFQRPENLPPARTAEAHLRGLFGNEGWETMWRPLLVNKFGEEDARRISAQWIAKRIQLRTGSQRRGREVLGYLDGSYRILMDRLRDAVLSHGGTIKLDSAVTNLPQTRSGGYAINGEEYDAVASTIAPNLMKYIAPQLTVPTVAYRTALVPLFFLRSQITPYYWINILDTDVPFSVIVNQQALLPPGYYRGLFPLYIGHYVSPASPLLAKSDGELAAYYLSYLGRIFPGIEGEVVRYEIGRGPNAQPVVTAPWQPLRHVTNLPNLFMTSMAHIFPEDRGANYAIREALRIRTLINGHEGRPEGIQKEAFLPTNTGAS